MPDLEDCTLHGVLVAVGGVAVVIGIVTLRFGAEATLGALMMMTGLLGLRTTPSRRA